MTTKILFTNLGYARGIDGTLRSHIKSARYYINCPPGVQMKALESLKVLLHQHQIDLVCIAEIDSGSSNNSHYDQMHFLRDSQWAHGQAINKYGKDLTGKKRSVAKGKSNGFLSRIDMPFQARYLSSGTKRLICQLQLKENIAVWFGHFSLRPWIRERQFAELASWLNETEGEVLILGDFNTYRGVGELRPLIETSGLQLLSPPVPTFRFAGYQAPIDLCLATKGLVERCHVHILPQPFSDHDALLVEMR